MGKDDRRKAMKKSKRVKRMLQPTGGMLSVSGHTTERADATTDLILGPNALSMIISQRYRRELMFELVSHCL